MRMPARHAVVTGCCALLLVVVVPSVARANIGPRWWGDTAAEPQGLKGVTITREELTIDLRPLAEVQPARVEAVYHVHNPGPAKKLDLLFIAGGDGVSNFEIRLGDRLVESRSEPPEERPGHAGEPPENWKPPRQLPGIDGSDTFPLTRESGGEFTVLAFAIELPPGRSTLTALYQVRACGTDEGYPTATWQFPYVLAPAKEWGGFGGLDVVVHLPEGWQTTSTPALARDGDVMWGHFEGLPSDWLAVGARRPVGPELKQAVRIYGTLYAGAVVAGGVFCRLLGRGLWRAATGSGFGIRASFRFVFAGILGALLWEALVYAAVSLARDGIYSTLAGQESPYFQEHFWLPQCGNLLLMVLILPAGFFIAGSAAGGSRAFEAK